MVHERIKEGMLRIAAIGTHENGGTNRVFGSENFSAGQKEVLRYFEECGLETEIDTVGNVHGILRSSESDEEIWIGSHIDTVVNGGIYDGLLGVIAGAECLREIGKSGSRLKKTLHLVGTNGEEGNAMGGTFGSRAMMGLLPTEDPEYLKTGAEFGYSKEALLQASGGTEKARCYLELHIEQGPTLDTEGDQIGIVTGIVGLRRYRVTVHGVSNHSGTTMMKDRNDALVSAARVILTGDRIAKEIGNNFVETVSLLTLYPASAAVIPEKVVMTLEIRNEDEALMDRFMQWYSTEIREIADCEIEPLVSKAPVSCDESLVVMLTEICEEQKLRYRIMPSGATHDGNAMAMKMPIGMIFIPSVRGISHSPEEYTSWEDVYRGADVLYEAIRRLAL